MPYRLFSLSFILLSSIVFGDELKLLETQKNSIELSKTKALEDSEAKKYEWINPINFQTSYYENEHLGYGFNSKISINQPIFKSGAIESSMKFAQNLLYSTNISIEIQKKKLIKDAINIAFNLKKIDLQLEQTTLLLENAKIDLKIKKESVAYGLLDISFLNNAILNQNNIEAKLLELNFTKENYLNSFKNLSSQNPYELTLPVLFIVTKDEFKKNNLEMKQNELQTKNKEEQITITSSRFLPSFNINGSYEMDHKNENKTNNQLGAALTIPLDFNYYANQKSAKVDFLKSKQDLEILNKKEEIFFNSSKLKLNLLESKIKLAKENIELYDSLLKQNIELSTIGAKTKDDILILKNTKNSERLNLSIYEIEKQIELLEIYGKIENETI